VGSEKDPRHYTSGMMAGVPVIRGTRVPLWTLIEYLEDGRGLERFLTDHPQVTQAQANLSLVLGLQALMERRTEVGQLGQAPPAGASKTTPPKGGPER